MVGKERERKGMYVRVRGMKETRKERGGRERDRGIGENRSVPLQQGIRDEIWKFHLRMCRRWGVLQASEEMCYETGTKPTGRFVAIEWV